MLNQIRTIALVGHGGAGKTSLAEVMLYKAGITNRLGRVEDGNTVMDFEPEEIKRNSSLSTGFHPFNWKKHTVNLIDTPGDQNFFSDTKSCMQAADGVVVVVPGDGLPDLAEALPGIRETVERGSQGDGLGDFGQSLGVAVPALDVAVRGVGAVEPGVGAAVQLLAQHRQGLEIDL